MQFSNSKTIFEFKWPCNRFSGGFSEFIKFINLIKSVLYYCQCASSSFSLVNWLIVGRFLIIFYMLVFFNFMLHHPCQFTTALPCTASPTHYVNKKTTRFLYIILYYTEFIYKSRKIWVLCLFYKWRYSNACILAQE